MNEWDRVTNIESVREKLADYERMLEEARIASRAIPVIVDLIQRHKILLAALEGGTVEDYSPHKRLSHAVLAYLKTRGGGPLSIEKEIAPELDRAGLRKGRDGTMGTFVRNLNQAVTKSGLFVRIDDDTIKLPPNE